MPPELWDPLELEAASRREQAALHYVDPIEHAASFARRRARVTPARRRRRENLIAIDAGLLPRTPREVIDAVRAEILTPQEARRYFGVAARRQTGYWSRALWGCSWRWTVLLGVGLCGIGLNLHPSALSLLAFAVAGLALGLWHRRRAGLGPLWRALVVAGAAVYLAPVSGLLPAGLAGAAGYATLLPWWVARR